MKNWLQKNRDEQEPAGFPKDGEEAKAPIRRYRFVFYGRVQGVGFRWRVRMAAGALGLTGWVANEWDGSVRMEIQGTDAEIAQVLSGLTGDRYIDITEFEQEEIPLQPKERSFRVGGY